MPANCCVPYCDTGHVKNGKLIRRAMFTAPKNDSQREMWARMIPRKGTLNPTDKVCSVHFEEHDIHKANKFIIEDKEVFLPMLNWRLKKNALPRIFPGCPINLNKSPKKRKPPKDRSKLPVKSTKLSYDSVIQQVSVTQEAEMNGSNSHLNLVNDNTISLLLPFQYPPLTNTYFNKKKVSSEEEHLTVAREELPSESMNNLSSKSIDVSDADQEEVLLNYISAEMNPTELPSESFNNFSSKSIDVSDADQEEVILNYISVEMNPTNDRPSLASLIRSNTPVVRSSPQPITEKEEDIPSNVTELNSNQVPERSQDIHVNIRDVRLPSLSWAWIQVEIPNRPSRTNMICAENVYIAGKVHIRRSVEIDLLTGVACYSLFGAFLGLDSLNTTFSSESELSELLRCYGETKLCPGLPVSQFTGKKISPSSLGYQDGQVLRSSRCTGIEPNSNPCNNCLLLLSRNKS